MPDKSKDRVGWPKQLRQHPRSAERFGKVQESFGHFLKDKALPGTREWEAAVDEFLDSPDLTPVWRRHFEDAKKDIQLYKQWNEDALRRGMKEIARYEYMPEFVDEFSKTHSNLTRSQIEAEYSTLFDDVTEQTGQIRPYDFNDFNDRLKERLDANADMRGDRLDTHTRGDRLDIHTQNNNLGHPTPFDVTSETATAEANGIRGLAAALARRGIAPQAGGTGKFSNIARALVDLEARQRRQFYGGPR